MIIGKDKMSKILMIFKKIDSKDEYQENNASFLRKAVFGMKEMLFYWSMILKLQCKFLFFFIKSFTVKMFWFI